MRIQKDLVKGEMKSLKRNSLGNYAVEGYVMEVYRVIINVIALAVNVCLVYFAVRLLYIFKGGKMKKPWIYISSGVLALAISSSLFALHYLFEIHAGLHAFGGVLMVIGGLLLLVGMYLEYRSWAKPL